MKRKRHTFCPNCSIGLNSQEISLKFCRNCKHDWVDDENEIDFQSCDECDNYDACEDFGCAIKSGIKS